MVKPSVRALMKNIKPNKNMKGYDMVSQKIKLIEVGPRDGLQNEKQTISTEDKIKFINALSETGLSYIESGSFVSPKWIPQMASSKEVFSKINRHPHITYAALVPNMQGLESAILSDVEEILIFTSASESFCQKNINCSIADSLTRFIPVVEKAKSLNIRVRGAVSCVLGCPYEGDVSPAQVTSVVNTLIQMGCYEVLLGDTIGIGSVAGTDRLLQNLTSVVDIHKVAGHYHDTYGQALANIYVSLQWGMTTFDSSVAGLGGCPYAKGATGNVATEDVLFMLNDMGIETGVNLEKLIAAGEFISNVLKRDNGSRVAKAMKDKVPLKTFIL